MPPKDRRRLEAVVREMDDLKAKMDDLIAREAGVLAAMNEELVEVPNGVNASYFNAYRSMAASERGSSFAALHSNRATLDARICSLQQEKVQAMNEPADPIAMLADADKACPQEEWLLSSPLVNRALPETANLATLKVAFQAAEQNALGQLPECQERRGVTLLGVQAGMGIGKSYAIDIVDKLLFVGKNPIVLKATYNLDQSVAFERNASNTSKGLLARLILAYHKRVSPSAWELVMDAVQADASKHKLTVEAVVSWIREQDGDADTRPIIIAVDELALLENDEACREVLLCVSRVITEFWVQSGDKQEAIGLVTALPLADLKRWSRRQPIMLRPHALSYDESKALLKERCGTTLSENELLQLLMMCGGHPRSLAVAAKLYRRKVPPVVPSPNDVAVGCMWKSKLGSTAAKVSHAIQEAFLRGDHVDGTIPFESRAALQDLENNAMLMTRGGRYAVPLTVLYSDPSGSSLAHIHSMMKCPLGVPNTQMLESTNKHWEFFKAQNKLPVIPPSMAGANDPTYDYCFDPHKEVVKVSVLKQKAGSGVELATVDPESYYFPQSLSHRGFDSMCVAKSRESGKSVLCLFQSKINGDVSAAIEGLNQAAKELAGKHHLDAKLTPTWSEGFLFVVFALDCTPDGKATKAALHSAGDHRTILVHRGNLDDYFTATLAPVAEMCWVRHQQR